MLIHAAFHEGLHFLPHIPLLFQFAPLFLFAVKFGLHDGNFFLRILSHIIKGTVLFI